VQPRRRDRQARERRSTRRPFGQADENHQGRDQAQGEQGRQGNQGRSFQQAGDVCRAQGRRASGACFESVTKSRAWGARRIASHPVSRSRAVPTSAAPSQRVTLACAALPRALECAPPPSRPRAFALRPRAFALRPRAFALRPRAFALRVEWARVEGLARLARDGA